MIMLYYFRAIPDFMQLEKKLIFLYVDYFFI